MTKRPHVLFALIAVAAVWLGGQSRALGVTLYGTAAAQAALQFNPFDPTAPTVAGDAFLLKTQPILVPKAASVQVPSLADVQATPPVPVVPVLDVVDAPRVFEGPYLKGLKASFVITIKPSSKKTVTVKYSTANGTARAGIEYKAKSGIVSFPPGQVTQTVLVDILNDDLKVNTNPPPRRFFLDIFTPSGAKIGRSRGSAEITENGMPNVVGVVVSNALPVFEVGSGKTAMFTVSLNQSSSKVVKVQYKTQNGSAVAGQDYKAASGTLTFQPGQTMKTVSVQIFDNVSTTTEKLVETFSLVLSNPSNAVILHSTGVAEILEFKQ
jgi:hypothetical protein